MALPEAPGVLWGADSESTPLNALGAVGRALGTTLPFAIAPQLRKSSDKNTPSEVLWDGEHESPSHLAPEGIGRVENKGSRRQLPSKSGKKIQGYTALGFNGSGKKFRHPFGPRASKK